MMYNISTKKEEKKMKVTYKGMHKKEGYTYRQVEVEWDDENEREERLFNRIYFAIRRVDGWDLIHDCQGHAYCEVEDMDEFKMFAKDFRKWRKCISDCEKYGF